MNLSSFRYQGSIIMKLSVFISAAAIFLGSSAIDMEANPKVSMQESNISLTRTQALQVVRDAPNFKILANALKNSGNELDVGKAAFSPDSKGSGYKTLVIKNKRGSEVVEASFDGSILSELVLISPPNTVVNVLEGTVQKFDLQKRSLLNEGRWSGTDSLKHITEIAPKNRGDY